MFLWAIAVIPLVPAYLWFRHKKYGVWKFFLPAFSGIISVFIAGLAQNLFPLHISDNGMADLLFGVFIRVSLTEELTRTVMLFLVFNFFPFVKIMYYRQTVNPGDLEPVFFGAPSGLAAGLGFAAGESIFYGLPDFRIALLRIVTAAPLHAACGARIGSALGMVKKQPVSAFVLFFSAFFIHGMYNFCIENPGLPRFFPAFIAFAALISSILNIYYGDPKPGITGKNKC